MSKLCLVEVGKFLDILKSQHWFKWPKIANGPIFLPWFIIPSMCTTTWPKGKYFLIFYLFIWIFIYINSIKSIKYMKNIKLALTNLFMHVWYSRFRVQLNGERFGADWHDWEQNTHEKIWKRSLRNQILKTIMAMDLIEFCCPNTFTTKAWT